MAGIENIMEVEDVRALADLGFMAISRGLDGEAASIFEGVVAARPDNEAGHIGQALVLLFRNEPDRAVAVLRKLPPSDAAQLFLGMALARKGERSEAREVLGSLVASAAGTPPAETARMILDELGSTAIR